MQPHSQSTTTLAVIGLGIIGKIWASHYHAQGWLTATWNRSPQPEQPHFTPELASLPHKADNLHIVVADPPAVQSVLDTILPQLQAKHRIIQSSTIDPASSDHFRQQVTQTGASYIEAPFTGSQPAAASRSLIFYLGGSAQEITPILPILDLLAKDTPHIGNHQQACALKLSMNLQIAAQAQALCESIELARSYGIDDDTYFQGLSLNASYSGLSKLKEPKLRQDDYQAQFSIKHLHKDIRLALTASPQTLPQTQHIQKLLAQAEKAGYAEEDFISLRKLLDA